MPQDDGSSNATQVIHSAEACKHVKKHNKKRHHKCKRDDPQSKSELIEQETAADDKHTRERHHKRKRNDESCSDHNFNEQEKQYEAVVTGRKETEKRHHKRKPDDSHKENELIELAADSGEVDADNNKLVKKRHHKRKRDDDSLKENELVEQERPSKVTAVDDKHSKKMYHKRKRDDSHKKTELTEREAQFKEVTAHTKKGMKIQNSKARDVNEYGPSDNPNCDGDVRAAGSESTTVSNKKPSTSGKGRVNKREKKVRFSSDVEMLHSTKKIRCKSEVDASGLVRGVRYTEEEDRILKDACLQYVENHNLEGVKVILNTQKYPQARGCWVEIGNSIPWRKVDSIYNRAAYIFRNRTEIRKWNPEEIEIIKRHVNEHGRHFKELADLFGVHRHQVRDAWRRNRLINAKKGFWSVHEYQKFFKLVNEDLKMKAFEEKSDNPSIKENISWRAISDKMATRYDFDLCIRWYKTLTSPMVANGLWSSCDDYRLLFNLSKLDACCFEDVDWDNLLNNRNGAVCRKRWLEMTRHIGGNIEKPFTEQVEILSSRYHIDILPYRKISLSESDSESEDSESDREAEPEKA